MTGGREPLLPFTAPTYATSPAHEPRPAAWDATT